jgi:hypothetical protein
MKNLEKKVSNFSEESSIKTLKIKLNRSLTNLLLDVFGLAL